MSTDHYSADPDPKPAQTASANEPLPAQLPKAHLVGFAEDKDDLTLPPVVALAPEEFSSSAAAIKWEPAERGEWVAGILIKASDGQYGPIYKLRSRYQKTEVSLVVFANAVLADRMEERGLKVGDYYVIQFEGLDVRSLDKGNATKMFRCWRRKIEQR